MIENIFRKKHAECLILRHQSDDSTKGEAVGLALVSAASNPRSCMQPLKMIVFLYVLYLAGGTWTLREQFASFYERVVFNWIQLEDLYIKEKHRGGGQGKRLFGELGAIAKQRGCARVEWRVLKVSDRPICLLQYESCNQC